jgi:ABC-2 type transport system ATP-binding protein
MSDHVFEASGIRKRFGRREVLQGLDLALPRGTVTVLLGENGAGKSTLLRLALGVLKPEQGTLRVLGLDPLRQSRAVRERVGYVPDVPDVWGWMTMADFLRFLAPHYPTWNRERAQALAAELRVPLDVRFKDLSRGQGMKAMLAAALAPEPELLLLDEPFAGLDPLVREEVLRGVIASLRQAGRTVLVTTHDLDVASRVADHVAVLARGRITACGTVAEVLGEAEPARVPERLLEVLRDEAAVGGGV